MSDKRIVAAVMGDGHIGLIEQDVPELKNGAVLVEVHNSLISPGTEIGGWRALSEQRKNPDTDAEPRPFGYSNAGIVRQVGQGVQEFKVGDRVACIGARYAQHTNVAVVPHNLCTPLPDKVTFAQGSYAMLAATALQAVRRLELQFGEFACVIGLGIVGQLTAQLLKLDGAYVIGWDTIPTRNEIAMSCGVDATVTVDQDDEIATTDAFTGGAGLDGAVLAFGGNADAAIASLEKTMKCSPDTHPMGTIVAVGQPSFEYTVSMTNIDIRRSSRTGPGYHDDAWEYGSDYPSVFMRWTTKTNVALCLRLIAEGRLNVDALTTHTVSLENVDAETSALLDSPDDILGVVFNMK